MTRVGEGVVSSCNNHCYRIGFRILLTIVALLASTWVYAAEQVITFGVLPAESPVALFKRLAPLREYLSKQLNQEVKLETARDFPEFARRTASRQYDIVLTAPHMAIPPVDAGTYILAATYVNPLKAVIVVAQTSPVKTLDDLVGKRIATPPKQAIITMVGKQYLKTKGVLEHIATRLSAYRSHNAAYSAVIAGEVDAALIADIIYLKAKKQNVPLREIAASEEFPGIGLLLAADLDKDLQDRITNSLIDLKDTKQGQALLKKISQPGYTSVDISKFHVLRPFVLSGKPGTEQKP